MDSKLGDEIANLVIKRFETQKLKGKPTIRSNGVKEWTVLAGIVAIHKYTTTNGANTSRNDVPDGDDDYSLDLIALTTGVKALPNDTIKVSDGLLLHDCHAEILALRAFNRFIVEQCSIDDSHYVTKNDTTGKYKLKDGIEFALYISELPCGDCSLDSLQEGQESWEDFTEVANGLIRGREGFGVKGRVRTKPGRRDSPVTLSKSCSDKLAVTQWKGMLSGLSSLALELDGFYIRWLVVPDDKFHETGLIRCFSDRCSTSKVQMKFLQTSVHHSWEKSDSDEKQVPSNSSVICIPSLNIEENIINSVKDGYYTKSKRPRKNGESTLSRVQLYKQISQVIEIPSSVLSYVELKSQNAEYATLKQSAQSTLKNWCKTYTDDFNL